MDVFYEESSINANAKKGERRYKILHVLSNIALVLGIILMIICISFFPFGLKADASADEIAAFQATQFGVGFIGVQGLLFLVGWFILFKVKARVNVSYDYIFVSGELRITKVFNVNKRKGVDRIFCDKILQIGDTDNPSFDRLRSAPNTKTILCTSNSEAAEGKFFMYILVAGTQYKYLYVLECREALLMQIMKFARRSVLESDYVMQEKKQKKA